MYMQSYKIASHVVSELHSSKAVSWQTQKGELLGPIELDMYGMLGPQIRRSSQTYVKLTLCVAEVIWIHM